MSRREAVLLDLDGVVIDSQRETSFFQVWSSFFLNVSKRVSVFDPVFDLAETIAGFGLRVPLVPGISETLRVLREAGVRLGIVTDRPALAVQRYFRRHRAVSLNDFAVIRTTRSPFDFWVKFPNPIRHISHNEWKNGRHLKEVATFLHETHNIVPTKLWYVGDRDIDFRAAQEAGIRFLASSWGHLSADEFHRLGVPESHLLRSPADLLRVVED